jgi:hypothetical protein
VHDDTIIELALSGCAGLDAHDRVADYPRGRTECDAVEECSPCTEAVRLAAAERRGQIDARGRDRAMRKQLESGLKAMEAGIAARNAVIEELKVGLEHERGERTKLAAELAEARKGWLERLLQAIRRR